MEANEYQVRAHEFARYGGGQVYPFMGIAEEAGEVVGKIAKQIRKTGGFDFGNTEFTSSVLAELGDVSWMLAECCTVIGVDLADVFTANIEKLEARARRGTICGSGDTNAERIALAELANAKFHIRRLIDIAQMKIEEDNIGEHEVNAALKFLGEKV